MQNCLFPSLQAIWTGEGSALVLLPFPPSRLYLTLSRREKRRGNISLQSWTRLQFSLHRLSLLLWLTLTDHHCPLQPKYPHAESPKACLWALGGRRYTVHWHEGHLGFSLIPIPSASLRTCDPQSLAAGSLHGTSPLRRDNSKMAHEQHPSSVSTWHMGNSSILVLPKKGKNRLFHCCLSPIPFPRSLPVVAISKYATYISH